MSQVKDQIKTVIPCKEAYLIVVELSEFPDVRLIEFVTAGTPTQYGHHTEMFGADFLSEAEYSKIDDLVRTQEFKDHMTGLVNEHFPVAAAA